MNTRARIVGLDDPRLTSSQLPALCTSLLIWTSTYLRVFEDHPDPHTTREIRQTPAPRPTVAPPHVLLYVAPIPHVPPG